MPDTNLSKPVPPHETLPPVEPPSASFLIQLFVIPGIIVGVIVLVWVLFNWIAHSGSGDPQDYIEALRHNSADVFQKLEFLAEALQNDRRGEFKNNANFAGELADILQSKISTGDMDSTAINLRVYLCIALGKFNTPVGLPALMKAASTNRDEAELPVRRAALQAIGDLADNVRATTSAPLSDPALTDMLLAASRDPAPVIRLRAAFVMGRIGGTKEIARLAELLDDPYPDVSYNAATALARQGDARPLDTLRAMLHVDKSSASLASEDPDLRDQKRWSIVMSALSAIGALAEKNHDADLSSVEPDVRAWTRSDASAAFGVADVPIEVRGAALTTDEILKNRPAASHAAAKH